MCAEGSSGLPVEVDQSAQLWHRYGNNNGCNTHDNGPYSYLLLPCPPRMLRVLPTHQMVHWFASARFGVALYHFPKNIDLHDHRTFRCVAQGAGSLIELLVSDLFVDVFAILMNLKKTSIAHDDLLVCAKESVAIIRRVHRDPVSVQTGEARQRRCHGGSRHGTSLRSRKALVPPPLHLSRQRVNLEYVTKKNRKN